MRENFKYLVIKNKLLAKGKTGFGFNFTDFLHYFDSQNMAQTNPHLNSDILITQNLQLDLRLHRRLDFCQV